jgi:hypothetical protein
VGWIGRLYASSDALGELVLRLGKRAFLAVAIAGGTGFATWAVPFTGELGIAPLWTLLLCWALLFGLATRPVAPILSAVAPIALSTGTPIDLKSLWRSCYSRRRGRGGLSLDSVAMCWAGVTCGCLQR